MSLSIFSSPLQIYRKRYCTTSSGIDGSRVISKMFKFYVEGFYLICKALSGELSCLWTGLIFFYNDFMFVFFSVSVL